MSVSSLTLTLVLSLVSSLIATKMYKAPSSSRIPGYYIIGTREWEVAEDLMEDLEVMDANQSLPGFSAMIRGILKETFYGFSAQLSLQALDHVSPLLLNKLP